MRKFTYFSALVLLLGVAYVFTLYFSFHRGNAMVVKYAPLVDAAMEIKLEVTMSHRYLEEMIHGEIEKNLDKAISHLDNAIWYADAILNGGNNQEGTFLPLEDLVMRKEIIVTLNELKNFKQATINRFQNTYTNVEDESSHKKYHTIFSSFIQHADNVETRLQQLIATELETYNFLKIFLVSISIFSVIGVLIFKILNDRRRHEFIETIEQQNSLLTELSNTDALTNIANRRYFDKFADEKFAWARRKHESITIMMIDVDYFKQYNDTYGHDAGDKCLQKLSLEMKILLRRPTDLVARYGGEEFIMVLLDTNNIEEFAENIRKSIEELQISHESSLCSNVVTVSIGVASGIPTEDMHPYSLVKYADEALYTAKNDGRNRVSVKVGSV